MKNEGWIYCGTNKNPDLDGYIKIGKSTNSASSREDNTNGAGYNIFFAVKVDDCVFYEKLIHKMFEDFNYQNLSNPKKKKDSWTEWFEIKFETLLPFLLEIATDFEIRDEDYCTKICKTIKENSDFYKILINREPSKYKKLNEEIKNNYGYCPLLDGIKFDNKNSDCALAKQPTPQNNVCKYETPCKNGKIIDWNLFFENNQQLVGENVYPFRKVSEVGKIIKLKSPKRGANFGILYRDKEISFSEFCKQNISFHCCAYDHIYFLDTNKTIKQTYEELKWK